MKVDSVRYKAFATNSSSVHTPIIVTGKTPKDYLIDEGYDFGWGPFIAASPTVKRYYAASALRTNLSLLGLNKDSRDSIIKDWVGVVPSEDQWHIDHQSVPLFPMEYADLFSGKGISKEYFMAYYNWLMQENLIMVGGNDNGEQSDDNSSLGTAIAKPYLTEMSPKAFVVKADPKGFFTIFNKEDGTKVRMSFNDGVDMSKGTTPELVDLKITDWCDRECGYCYQGSTTKGKHADSEYIKYSVLSALSQMQVLEVALGGGEPTAHPDFWRIVREAHRLGITPSFSTRRLGWIEDPFKLKAFNDTCGAFAYSVDSRYSVHKLIKAMYKYDLEDKVTLQYVPEVNPYSDLEGITNLASSNGIPLTLLGYKTTGRGGDYKRLAVVDNREYPPITAEQWKRIMSMGATISVDTAFASTHQELLRSAGVADWSYRIKEGAHSMYIDAVTREAAKSSYVEPSDRRTLTEAAHSKDVALNLTRIFKEFGSEQTDKKL